MDDLVIVSDFVVEIERHHGTPCFDVGACCFELVVPERLGFSDGSVLDQFEECCSRIVALSESNFVTDAAVSRAVWICDGRARCNKPCI